MLRAEDVNHSYYLTGLNSRCRIKSQALQSDMKEKLVCLPSGTVLNIDRVAFVAPLPDAAKRRRKIRVFFAPAGSSGSPVSMFLDRDDSKALIETLSKLGLDVTALRRAMVGRK